MSLTDDQVAYLDRQRLGRLATIDADGDPQINPVSCYYNPALGTIDIGGHDMAGSRKYRNVRRNQRGAVVVDDMTPGDPPTIRCMEIRGRAEALDAPDDSAARVPGAIIRIHPGRVLSWGLDTTPVVPG